jgi:DNA repair photolyase
VEEKVPQKSEHKISPAIVRLKNIDFWYWTRYHVEIRRTCPYRCGYCNTQLDIPMSGVRYLPGLPNEPRTIGLGLLSDPYHPDSRKNGTVANILEMFCEMQYPVNILTKSNRVIQHLDILKKLAKKDLVRVTFSVLTPDEKLAAMLEGVSPSPSSRLEALKTLRNAGIPAGIAITPIIPHVTDSEEALTRLVRLAGKHGACWALFSGFDPNPAKKDLPRLRPFYENAEDEDALEKRYSHIKRFMVRLLDRENLPMRIPRITLKRFTNRYFSSLVSECLFNISYMYELLDRKLEMLRYRRAACDIEDLNVSLKTLVCQGKLGNLKGINPEIEGIIKEVLFKGSSEFYKTLYRKAATGA